MARIQPGGVRRVGVQDTDLGAACYQWRANDRVVIVAENREAVTEYGMGDGSVDRECATLSRRGLAIGSGDELISILRLKQYGGAFGGDRLEHLVQKAILKTAPPWM